MPRNLSTGVYTAPAGTTASYGSVISPSAYNSFVADIGSEMTNSVDVRGETPMVAALNMGGNKLVNVAAGVAGTDAVNVSQLAGGGVPPGLICHFPSSTAPSGWYVINGQAVSRTGNPTIFGMFGTTYGAGDGSTTFNLPTDTDLIHISAGNLYAGGATGGAKTQTLVAANLPPHTHSITDVQHTHTQNAHTHTVTEPNSGSGHQHGGVPSQTGAAYGGGILGASSTTAGTQNTSYATTGITIANATAVNQNAYTGLTTTGNNSSGTSTAFSILPPYRAWYPIIKGG